jgi:sec-independent protein translocase protein TatA
MGLSIGHLVVILIIVLLLFGAGRVPQIMGDLAKGLRSFKDNLKDDEKDKIDKK